VIRLSLLGRTDLLDGNGQRLDAVVAQRKRFALLAYLAATSRRGFHSRDRLLLTFWPEEDQERARASLRKAVHVLRQSLGEGVFVSRGDDEVGLAPDAVWCDVVAFDEAVEKGQLARALELYRGDLLEGFFIPGHGEFEGWLETERARLRTAAARTAWALADRFEGDRSITMATQWARRAAELSGIEDERAVRKVIALLARAGDRAGALATYEAFRKRLATVFEVEPARETVELVESIRRG
jgi:DNA-binding SARP family transcriptional activator